MRELQTVLYSLGFNSSRVLGMAVFYLHIEVNSHLVPGYSSRLI